MVEHFAAGLVKLGVEKGDRTIIYMPMVLETVVAMLATVRIGAIHSVVFGGFSAMELGSRIKDCQPKLVITASAGKDGNKVIKYLEVVAKALEIAE